MYRGVRWSAYRAANLSAHRGGGAVNPSAVLASCALVAVLGGIIDVDLTNRTGTTPSIFEQTGDLGEAERQIALADFF